MSSLVRDPSDCAGITANKEGSVDPFEKDDGCSEAGHWWPDGQYGMGECPIRKAPCPTGCLRKTIVSMKLTIDSQPLREEVLARRARAGGITDAAKLAKKVGSRSVARAIEALKTGGEASTPADMDNGDPRDSAGAAADEGGGPPIGTRWGDLSAEERAALPVGTVFSSDGTASRTSTLRPDGWWGVGSTTSTDPGLALPSSRPPDYAVLLALPDSTYSARRSEPSRACRPGIQDDGLEDPSSFDCLDEV